MYQKGSGFLGLLIIIALIWWGISWWRDDNKVETIRNDYGYEVEQSTFGQADCSSLEPENPYGYDSGHYAGYEWGENGNSCGGNSSSFVEGCEEYEAQEEAYEYCLSN